MVVPDEHASGYEIAQLLDQHLLADARDEALEVSEPLGTSLEMIKDQRLPFPAHDGERDVKATHRFNAVKSHLPLTFR